ncbi:uncharacterized protein LOC127835687 [Dreissena polymorpha]|uniref:uncharacterized protein LOC127835687 n=1 Tax=Dreissena polymorpha TaxID=45954 RepID=UPI0022655216|nr:uncharacterized protein LOC127835687 [Dreissena polymorpha]
MPEERNKDARGRKRLCCPNCDFIASLRRLLRPYFDYGIPNATPVRLKGRIKDAPPVITLLPSTGSSINDGLQAAAAALHTFSVTDSDDLVTSSIQAPEATFFEVEAATSPAPTFVTGIPGNSTDVSDDIVIATSLGKFTTTDPDTTCSVTSPVTTVYEIRKIASPTDPQKPEFEVWISNAVTQASIDFNDQAVPLPLTIKCTDGNVVNDITGTFNVNIVDSPPVFTALPATGTNIFDGLKHATETLHTFSVIDSDDTVMCSARSPENDLFEVGAGVAPSNKLGKSITIRTSFWVN